MTFEQAHTIVDKILPDTESYSINLTSWRFSHPSLDNDGSYDLNSETQISFFNCADKFYVSGTTLEDVIIQVQEHYLPSNTDYNPLKNVVDGV